MACSQIKSKRLSEVIYSFLKEQILASKLLPGERLPILRLAEQLGISATPVREALAKLRTDGLIEHIPHRTAYVRWITAKEVSNAYEIRRLLEPYATSIVAECVRTDSALKKRMQKLRQRLLTLHHQIHSGPVSPSTYQQYLAVDRELQAVIEAVVSNPLLHQLVQLANERSSRIRVFARIRSFTHADTAQTNQDLCEVTDEHLSIVEAILSSSLRSAKQAVMRHLVAGEARSLRAILNESLSE